VIFPPGLLDSGIARKNLTLTNIGYGHLSLLMELSDDIIGHGAIFDVLNSAQESIIGKRFTIPQQGSSQLIVTFDYTSGLGRHQVDLNLQTNDLTHDLVVVPLYATVLNTNR
jgi:hypothetical protein